MHLVRISAVGAVLALAACVTSPPSPPKPAPAPPTCAGSPSPTTIATEIAALRQALATTLPRTQEFALGRDAIWVALTRRALTQAGRRLHRPQLLVVVDRSPSVQQLAIVLANPAGAWRVIGGSKVSTGEAGRRGYFITPTGVFRHDGAILDYRALGTFNENHIRGLGLKGMRVWDFGWQVAQKGWEPSGETGEMRLLMHATDPDYLEPRLGQPASKGCVRIPDAMNRFLDHYGVLDREYEALARQDRGYAATLAPDVQPTRLAGDTLVVVDSRSLRAKAHTNRAHGPLITPAIREGGAPHG